MLNKKHCIKIHVCKDVFCRHNSFLHKVAEANKANKTNKINKRNK